MSYENQKVLLIGVMVVLLAVLSIPVLAGFSQLNNSAVDELDYADYAPEQFYSKSEIASVEKYIASEIIGTERSVMINLLLALEEEDRANAVYVDSDGNVYATSQALKEDVVFLEEKDGYYVYPSGEKIVAPSADNRQSNVKNAATALPTRANDDGPYHRVKSNSGYSWASAYIYLGVKNTNIFTDTSNACAYAYLGGSAYVGANAYVEVDAGMQFSYAYNEWSVFLSVDKSATAHVTRFKADQDAFLKFYVPTNNKVTVSCTAIDEYNVKYTYSVTAVANGWRTDGVNCNVKRVTSIAQRVQDLDSTDYFEGAEWKNVRLGTSSVNNAAWSVNHTNNTESHPNNSAKVWVDYVDAANETDNINLNN